MTLSELRDEAARLLGWVRTDPHCEHWRSSKWDRGEGFAFGHPIPLTLDFVADAMPKGWLILIEQDHTLTNDDKWNAEAMPMDIDSRVRLLVSGPAELHARLALLVAALRHEKGEST